MLFVLFGYIWDSLVALQHSVQNRPTWCKSSCHEVASEFFVTNAPNPLHWTLNSCFGVFCTIWMHLGPFGCLTKLSAKRAELVQKFVSRSHVVIFRNKHTGLTPLGCKLMFWCVSYYLGAFGTIWLPYKTRRKTGVVQKFVPWSRVVIFHNKPLDRLHRTLTSCFVAFRTIWMHLGKFGCITTLSAKWANLV